VRGLIRTAACLSILLCAFSLCFANVLIPPTMTRDADPVFVQGKQLPWMMGKRIDHLRLYAFHGTDFVPVPFQVDERDPDGEYVFPLGPKANADSDNGLFDENDELVFMVRDGGGRGPLTMWVGGWEVVSVIELTDPVDGAKSWVYLMSFANPPAPSDVDYVRYEPETATIYARNYTMGFHPEAPIGIGRLSMTEAGGGTDRDMADRLKIRFRANTVFGINVYRQEEMFTSKAIAWIDGPVRIVRRTKNRMVLFWKIPTPSALLDNIYYFNAFEFPTRVHLPFDSDTFIREVEFRVSTDNMCAFKGRYFYNEKNTKGVLINGVTSEQERNLDTGSYGWMVVAGTLEGERGAWLNRLLYDPTITSVRPTLYYRDQMSNLDPPEDEPGECGDVGYYLEGVERMEKGTFELISIMYNFTDYKPGMERRYLDILDRPLQIRAYPVLHSGVRTTN